MPVSKVVQLPISTKWWKNIPLFTPFRYVRGVAVQINSVLALALNGGQCSTLHLTISHPGTQHHYPLNMGLSGLESNFRCFVRGENFLPLKAYKPQNTRSVP